MKLIFKFVLLSVLAISANSYGETMAEGQNQNNGEYQTAQLSPLTSNRAYSCSAMRVQSDYVNVIVKGCTTTSGVYMDGDFQLPTNSYVGDRCYCKYSDGTTFWGRAE